MAARSENAEYLALDKHRVAIEERIVSQAGLHWFQLKLLENDLIISEKANDIISKSHSSDSEKARHLLEAVVMRIKHDHTKPEKPFQKFVDLLEGKEVFRDLGQMLDQTRQDFRQFYSTRASTKPSRRKHRKSESENTDSINVADSGYDTAPSIPQHHLSSPGSESELLKKPVAAFHDTSVYSPSTNSEESQNCEEGIHIHTQETTQSTSGELISGATTQHHPVDNHSASVVVPGKSEQISSSLDDIRDGIVKHIDVLKSQLKNQGELESEVKKLERRVTELTEEQEHLQSELQQVQSDSKAKVDSLENTVHSLEIKLTSKTQELEESNQELQKCKQELHQKKDQLAQREQELEELKHDQSAAIQKAVAEREKEIKRIQASCEELKGEKKDKEIELLKTKLEYIEKIHGLKDQLSQRVGEAAEFKARITEMNAAIELKEKDKQILEKEAEIFEVKRSNSEEMAHLRRRLSELEIQNDERKRLGRLSHTDSDYM